MWVGGGGGGGGGGIAPSPPLTFGDKNIPWETEIKYLGMAILAASRFTICLHRAKIKYFQCLNTILGKIGDVHVVGLILSLIASNCTPVLVYGVEACLLSKAQLLSISYAYNAVFVKLFKSFDVKTIRACQFYTNFLSSEHSIGAARLKFLSSLST